MSRLQYRSMLFLYRLIGWITPPSARVIYSSDDPYPRSFLFFFPLGVEAFVESRYVLDKLEEFGEHGPPRGNPDITLVIPRPFRDLIDPPRCTTFFYPLSLHRVPRADVDVLRTRFHFQKFDAVVNLDPELDVRQARIISRINAPLRIGFAGIWSDSMYNLQISPNKTGSLHGAYDQLLHICGLEAEDKFPAKSEIDPETAFV